MESNVLEIKNLEKTYPKNSFSLKGISFSVPKGSIVGIIGENGSGKTTTINLILGLLRKDNGIIKLFGKELTVDDIETKEKIGVSFDEIYLPSNITAEEVSKINKKIYDNWNEKYFFEALDHFCISVNKKISDYSKGMQKMLSIVIAMSHLPQLLILDEPTSSLDPVKRKEVLEKFQEYIEDGENSIVFSSHITTDIEHVCDYVVYINKGKLIFFEPITTLLYDYCVVKCTSKALKKIKDLNVVAYEERNNQHVLLMSSREGLDSYSDDIIVENPTLEEIMNIYSKGRVL